MTKEERRAREIETLKKKSPMELPNNPSQSGWSTEQIKNQFYSGLLYLYTLFDGVREDAEDKHEGMVVRNEDGSINVPLNPTNNQDAVSKQYVDTMLADVMRVSGDVENEDNLPAGAQIGDTYNDTATGNNYVWNGYSWDRLSGDLDAGEGLAKVENTISSLTTATDVVINIKD